MKLITFLVLATVAYLIAGCADTLRVADAAARAYYTQPATPAPSAP